MIISDISVVARTLRRGGQLLGPLTVNTSDRFVEQRSNLLAAGEAEQRLLNQCDALADKLLRQIGFEIANMEPAAPANE